jgi:hypothetical protein
MTNARHRLQRLAHNGAGEAQYPIGTPNDSGVVTYLKARHNGGLIIGRGTVRILLDADDAAELIEVAQELTKPSSPHSTTPAKARLQRFPMTAKGA